MQRQRQTAERTDKLLPRLSLGRGLSFSKLGAELRERIVCRKRRKLHTPPPRCATERTKPPSHHNRATVQLAHKPSNLVCQRAAVHILDMHERARPTQPLAQDTPWIAVSGELHAIAQRVAQIVSGAGVVGFENQALITARESPLIQRREAVHQIALAHTGHALHRTHRDRPAVDQARQRRQLIRASDKHPRRSAPRARRRRQLPSNAPPHRAAIQAVVIVPVAAPAPRASAHGVAQRSAAFVQRDGQGHASVGIRVVLVQAASRQLAQRAIRVAPSIQLGLVEMTTQQQIEQRPGTSRRAGQQTSAAFTVGQVGQRMMNQPEPITRQRRPTLARSQPHHLIIGEPQVASVAIIASKPGRIKADDMNIKRPLGQTQRDPITEPLMRRTLGQKLTSANARQPPAIRALALTHLRAQLIVDPPRRPSPGHPLRESRSIMMRDVLAQRGPRRCPNPTTHIVVTGDHKQPRHRQLQTFHRAAEKRRHMLIFPPVPRERQITSHAHQIKPSLGEQLIEILLPSVSEHLLRAPIQRLTRVQVRDMQHAHDILHHADEHTASRDTAARLATTRQPRTELQPPGSKRKRRALHSDKPDPHTTPRALGAVGTWPPRPQPAGEDGRRGDRTETARPPVLPRPTHRDIVTSKLRSKPAPRSRHAATRTS